MVQRRVTKLRKVPNLAQSMLLHRVATGRPCQYVSDITTTWRTINYLPAATSCILYIIYLFAVGSRNVASRMLYAHINLIGNTYISISTFSCSRNFQTSSTIFSYRALYEIQECCKLHCICIVDETCCVYLVLLYGQFAWSVSSVEWQQHVSRGCDRQVVLAARCNPPRTCHCCHNSACSREFNSTRNSTRTLVDL